MIKINYNNEPLITILYKKVANYEMKITCKSCESIYKKRKIEFDHCRFNKKNFKIKKICYNGNIKNRKEKIEWKMKRFY